MLHQNRDTSSSEYTAVGNQRSRQGRMTSRRRRTLFRRARNTRCGMRLPKSVIAGFPPLPPGDAASFFIGEFVRGSGDEWIADENGYAGCGGQVGQGEVKLVSGCAE